MSLNEAIDSLESYFAATGGQSLGEQLLFAAVKQLRESEERKLQEATAYTYDLKVLMPIAQIKEKLKPLIDISSFEKKYEVSKTVTYMLNGAINRTLENFNPGRDSDEKDNDKG